MTKLSSSKDIAMSVTTFIGRFLFSSHKTIQTRIKQYGWDRWKDGFMKGYKKGYEKAESDIKERIKKEGVFGIMK